MNKFEFIESFKSMILNDVWTNFLTERKSEVQEPIGMWRWAGDCVPFAGGIQAVTIEKGVLSFKILINGKEMLFSIWVQMGEVRIGYRIPVELLQTNRTSAEQKLSAVYDGQPCPRIVRDKDAILFDMLFKDGFADFDYMNRACIDHKSGKNDRALIIADRIHSIFVHIFIAVINETINLNNFAVRPGFVGSTKTFLIEINGNIDDFLRWAHDNQIAVMTRETILSGGLPTYVLRCEIPSSTDIQAKHSTTWQIVRAIHTLK